MGKRPFLLRASYEHRDRRPNTLIDGDHESLFLVAKKNGEAVDGPGYGTDLHFDNGLTHCASLAIRLDAKIRVAARIADDPGDQFGRA